MSQPTTSSSRRLSEGSATWARGFSLALAFASLAWTACGPVGDPVPFQLGGAAGGGAAGASSAGNGNAGFGAFAGSGNSGAGGAVGGGGSGGTGGNSTSAWEPFATLGPCQIERLRDVEAASPFFSWKPCGNDASCEVARPDFEPWGNGYVDLTPGSSMSTTGSTDLALIVGIGQTSTLILVTSEGDSLAAFKAADPDLCFVAASGFSGDELGVHAVGTAEAQYASVIMRLTRPSLEIATPEDVQEFTPYAGAGFIPELITHDAWLTKQAGESFLAVDRNNQEREVIPPLSGNALGRGNAHPVGGGRFAFSEIRVGASDLYDTIVISDWNSYKELIAVEGEDWGNGRWTGHGLAVLKGITRTQGSYLLFDRTELWYGALPTDGGPFAPQLIGTHATGGAANGELSEGAIGGQGYFIAALPPYAETPGDEVRFHSFSIWNIASKTRRDVQLEPGEALGGFLGVTPDYVYSLISDANQPNHLKRFKLKVN